eukprot:6466859-Amphidinium_carterae.1
MAPKNRRVNMSNVGAKRSKTSGIVENLIATEEAVQQQADKDWILEQLNLYPNKIRGVKAVLSLKQEDDYDKTVSFDPRLLKKSFQLLPPAELKAFFSKLGGWTMEELRALQSQDGRVFHKLMMRLCVVPYDCPIGAVIKKEFAELMEKRMRGLGISPSCIQWDRSFRVSWSGCGLYVLLPVFVDAEGRNADEHQYEFIECLGRKATLTGGCFQIKASWSLTMNWSLMEARVAHPSFPDAKVACYQFFNTDFSARLSIENVPELRLGAASAGAALALPDSSVEKQEHGDDVSRVMSPVQGPPVTPPCKAKSAEQILASASPQAEAASASKVNTPTET